MPKTKTIEDFPKFLVSAVRRIGTSEDGYTRFEIDGKFDRVIENIDPHWFWLLFGQRGSLCASLKSLVKDTKEAILTCDLREEPEVLGLKLAYLSPYWQAFHIWMVSDPSWGWQRKQFHSLDAIREEFETNDVSVINGREVKTWNKLTPLRDKTGQDRLYPTNDEKPELGVMSTVVPSGWDHEHCELCSAHIDGEDFGYCDPDERWLCESCYDRYVVPHDLSRFLEDDEIAS
jgi:hypothetical protein